MERPCDINGCHGLCRPVGCRAVTASWYLLSGTLFSEVYADERCQTAVKRYRTWDAPDDVSDFEQEAKILAMVKGCPHIIEPKSICHDCLQIWMPFYPGTLYTYNVGRWSNDKRKYVLGCVAKALQHTHSVGVVHCDVKRPNILTDIDGTSVVLTDWNSARTFREIADCSICCLEIHSSPEILMKLNGEYGPGIDIWAFGILCYDMFSKKDWALGTIKQINQFLNDSDRFAEFSSHPWLVELLNATLLFDHRRRATMKQIVDKWF